MRGLCFAIAVMAMACSAESDLEGDAGPPMDASVEAVDEGFNIYLAYWTLVIVDTSAEENFSGMPGVDICGVKVDEEVGSPEVTQYRPGDGGVCMSGDERCSDRSDVHAAEDDGTSCDDRSVPSDFVSLGMGGRLVLQFHEPIDGLDVTIVEHAGAENESYIVFVCEEENPTHPERDCKRVGAAEHGGTKTFTVPYW